MAYKINGTTVVDNSRNVCACCVTACCITGSSKVTVPTGDTASRPGNAAGQLYFDTDEGSLLVNDGSEWAAAGGAAAGCIYDSGAPSNTMDQPFGITQLRAGDVMADGCLCCCNIQCYINTYDTQRNCGCFPNYAPPAVFSTSCGQWVQTGTGMAAQQAYNACGKFYICNGNTNRLVSGLTCTWYNHTIHGCNTANYPSMNGSNCWMCLSSRLTEYAVYPDGSTIFTHARCSIPGSLKFYQTCNACNCFYKGGVIISPHGTATLQQWGLSCCANVCADTCLDASSPEQIYPHHPTVTPEGAAAKITGGFASGWTCYLGDSCNYRFTACSDGIGQESYKVCSDAWPYNRICTCGWCNAFVANETTKGLNIKCVPDIKYIPTGLTCGCHTCSCCVLAGLLSTNPALYENNKDAYCCCIGESCGACIMCMPILDNDLGLYINRCSMATYCCSYNWVPAWQNALRWFDSTCRYMYLLDRNCTCYGVFHSMDPDCACYTFCQVGSGLCCYNACACTVLSLHSLRIYDTCTASLVCCGVWRGVKTDPTVNPYANDFHGGDFWENGKQCFESRLCGFTNAICNAQTQSFAGLLPSTTGDRFCSYMGPRRPNDKNVIQSCTSNTAYISSRSTSCLAAACSCIFTFNFNTNNFDCITMAHLGFMGTGRGPKECLLATWKPCSSCTTVCCHANMVAYVCSICPSACACCMCMGCAAAIRSIGCGTIPVNWLCEYSCHVNSCLEFNTPSGPLTCCDYDGSLLPYTINPTNDHLIVPAVLQTRGRNCACYCTSACTFWYGLICYDLENKCISKVHSFFNGEQQRRDTISDLGTDPATNSYSGVQWGVAYPTIDNCYGSAACCNCSCQPVAYYMSTYGNGTSCSECHGMVISITAPNDSTSIGKNLWAHQSYGQYGTCNCAFACTCYQQELRPVCDCWCFTMAEKLLHLRVPMTTPLDCLGYSDDTDMKCFMEVLQGCHAMGRCYKCAWACTTDGSLCTGTPSAANCACCNAGIASNWHILYGFCGFCPSCTPYLDIATYSCSGLTSSFTSMCGCGYCICSGCTCTLALDDIISNLCVCQPVMMRNVGNALFNGCSNHVDGAFSTNQKTICAIPCLDVTGSGCCGMIKPYCTGAIQYLTSTQNNYDVFKQTWRNFWCSVCYPCMCCY